MTATALPFPQAPPQVWPRHTGREKERSFEGSGTRGGILSRRDLLKLIGAAGVLAFLGLMTGCSPAAETETSPGIDLNFTESMETGNFAMPIRPWAMQDGSPEVVSGDNLKFIIKNTPWVRAADSLITWFDNTAAVRASGDWGRGNYFGTVIGDSFRNWGPEMASTKSGWFSRPEADQELHFNVGQPALPQNAPSDAIPAQVSPSVLANRRVSRPEVVTTQMSDDLRSFIRGLGDQHLLVDMQTGEKKKLPGNVKQIVGLTSMFNLLYGRIVNDNAFQLTSDMERTEFYLQQRDEFLQSLFTLDSKTNQLDSPDEVVGWLVNALGYSGFEDNVVMDLKAFVVGLRDVDTTHIPSARLAESIALTLADADQFLVHTNITSAEVDIPGRADLYSFLDEKSVVPFVSEKIIEEQVSENWMRIPVARPRVFEMRVEKFKINDKKERVSDGFDRRIIFSSYTGDSKIYSDSKGNIGDFEPKLGDTAAISMDDLKNQQMLYEGNLFALNPGEELRQLNEVSPDKVRLYSVPNINKLAWGVETPKTGIVPNGLWDTFVSKLGIAYDKIQYQDILLDTGKEFISSPDGYFQQGWLTDMTEKWIQAQKEGVKELHSLGLFTPTEYLHRLARGPLFAPSDSNLKDLFLQYYIMSDFTNGTDNMKRNNFACTMTDRPVYSSFNNALTDAGTLKAGDLFAYDKNLIVVGGTPYMKIFSLAGGDLLTPLDFNSIQLIDNGTKDRMIETAKDWVPLALAAFGLGPRVYRGVMRILEFFF